MWKRRLSEMVTSAKGPSTGVPMHFSLEQNYPNPFNPGTTIRFDLPIASRATLKIYNTLGQEVALLVDDVRIAGVHTIEWNAANMTSGVYFCRLTAGTSFSVKKMILTK
jgi:hypothetical protein